MTPVTPTGGTRKARSVPGCGVSEGNRETRRSRGVWGQPRTLHLASSRSVSPHPATPNAGARARCGLMAGDLG